MEPNITDVTDRVFTYLDQPVVPQILELFFSDELEAEMAALEVEAKPGHILMRDQEILRQSHVEKIGKHCRNLLEDYLIEILPGSACWFKGENRPFEKLVWVVSPFEYHLMSPMTISIALQQHEERLMGILIIIDTFGTGDIRYITGEKESGAWETWEEYTVNENVLSDIPPNGMQVMPSLNNLPPDVTSKLIKFHRHWNQTLMLNRLTQNASRYMLEVAQGNADFTLGLNVSYHDIAAAICIAEQAGAVVTDFNNDQEGIVNGFSYFCSNEKIHAQFLEIIAGI